MHADPDSTLRTSAWERVARARARVDSAGGAAANRELFDAIEYAATGARLTLDELVDAYMAGAPDLHLGAVWEDVEDYLKLIAAAHKHDLDSAFARIERACPTGAGLALARRDVLKWPDFASGWSVSRRLPSAQPRTASSQGTAPASPSQKTPSPEHRGIS